MKCIFYILILYNIIAIYSVFNKTKTIVVSLIKHYMFAICMCPDILFKFDKCRCIRSGNIYPLTNTLKMWYNMKTCSSGTAVARNLYLVPNWSLEKTVWGGSRFQICSLSSIFSKPGCVFCIIMCRKLFRIHFFTYL